MASPIVAPSRAQFKDKFNSEIVVLTLDDWLHVQFRHPEVGTDPAVLLGAVSDPDEVHADGRGELQALRRVDQDHFLVVVYQSIDEAGGSVELSFGSERVSRSTKRRLGIIFQPIIL